MRQSFTLLALLLVTCGGKATYEGEGQRSGGEEPEPEDPEPEDPEDRLFIGGTVRGLSGSLTLSLNGVESLSITRDGSYWFESVPSEGDAFRVVAIQHPSGQRCSVARSYQLYEGASIENVNVYCQTYLPLARLTDAPPVTNGFFGQDLLLLGDQLITGTVRPESDAEFHTLSFARNPDGSFDELPTPVVSGEERGGDRFGSALASSGDLLAVGAYEDAGDGSGEQNYTGAVHVFDRDGDGWSFGSLLREPGWEPGEPWDGGSFGFYLAVLGDLLVVSASQSRAPDDAQDESEPPRVLYTYRIGPGGASDISFVEALTFGELEDVHRPAFTGTADGSRLALIASRPEALADFEDQKVVLVVELGDDGPREVARVVEEVPDAGFGSWMALDGDRLFVSASREAEPESDLQETGAVYCYELGPGGAQLLQKLRAPNPMDRSQFGRGVAAEGGYLLVPEAFEGGDGSEDDWRTGAVHWFRWVSGSYEPIAYSRTQEPQSEGGFGGYIAFDGNTLAVTSATKTVDGLEYAGAIEYITAPPIE